MFAIGVDSISIHLFNSKRSDSCPILKVSTSEKKHESRDLIFLPHIQPMETPQPSTVHLVLTTANDRIERVLYQRIHVKIGRQVKSPQEKLAAQEQEISPIEANQDTIRVKDAVFLNAPSPAQMKELDTISIDPVWFKSKVVSRSHAEIWLKDGQVSQINKVYLRDSGSSSGTFLNKMRLSPASKMSRPYPLREGDVIQLGVDYQGRTEGMNC
jgi:hypothetical protein